MIMKLPLSKQDIIKVPKTTLKPKPPFKGSLGLGLLGPKVAVSPLAHKTKKSTLSQRIAMPASSTTGTSSAFNPTMVTQLAPNATAPAIAAVVLPLHPATSTSSMRSIWYLGGNQLVQLLTSVDGDLDHAMLANICEVPSVIGDLALSVESLVSDDATVGGFEDELLARIAANTLSTKRTTNTNTTTTVTTTVVPPQETPFVPIPPQVYSQGSTSDDSSYHSIKDEEEAAAAAAQPQTFVDAAPYPLANYPPVPNPLARITPPGSPSTAMNNSNSNNKRNESPSTDFSVATKMVKSR